MKKFYQKCKALSKPKKAVLIILLVVLILIILHLVNTSCIQLALRKEIKSFAKVEYENQLVPEIGEEGYYTFTTDDDIKIMQISDIHLGGGIGSYKNDSKTLYEVATMVTEEKPDLVILNGDSVFCVPTMGFNGGETFNNKMVSKTIMALFDQLGVYYSVTFGNHDTEAFDFTNREDLGKAYASEDNKYCIFQSDFDEYGVTNQCILLKNTDGTIRKAIMLIDSNDYIDNSLSATINWEYDTINDLQVDWAVDTINSLSEKNGDAVKSIFFFHIPIGEYVTAYRDLEANDFEDTETTLYIDGYWDELVDEEMGERIWYGGCCQTDKDPKDVDSLFEKLGPDGINSMEACFCGHDHINSATVIYRGVMLSYGYSVDNNAYTGIKYYGIQRGATVITVKADGTFEEVHKNAYTDYHCSTDKYVDVNLTDWYYDGVAPTK